VSDIWISDDFGMAVDLDVEGVGDVALGFIGDTSITQVARFCAALAG
jgi:hypothetical protein